MGVLALGEAKWGGSSGPHEPTMAYVALGQLSPISKVSTPPIQVRSLSSLLGRSLTVMELGKWETCVSVEAQPRWLGDFPRCPQLGDRGVLSRQ